MHLAYVTAPGRGSTDRCLQEVAERLADLPLAGGVQRAGQRDGRDLSDMELALLPDGPVLRISQDLGPLAEGCRLDADALERAVALAADRLPAARALIVNKFGKQESLGRGFVPLIAAALEAGKPVLVGVNAAYVPGFRAFAGDLAVELGPNPGAVEDWLRGALAEG